MPNFKRRDIVLAILAQPLVVACGGGGGGNKEVSPTPPPVAETGATTVEFSGDPKSPTMAVVLDIRDGQVFGFITADNKPIAEASVASVSWGDGCKGHYISNPNNGVTVPFNNNKTVLGGLNPLGKGNLYLIDKTGKPYPANNDLVKLAGSIPSTFKPKDETGGRGFIQYGSVSDDPIVCPTPPPPPPPVVIKHEVTTKKVGGAVTMVVKLAEQDGKVRNLSGPNGPVDDQSILDVREIVWYGNCAGWTNGVRVPFNNNLTAIGGLRPSDRGNLAVFMKNGTKYFINTDYVAITGEGIEAVVKKDKGAIWYGDVMSSTISCTG